MLQAHFSKVNHILGGGEQADSAQDVYEYMEGDFHPCDKASMNAQIILPLLGAKKRSLLCSLIY